MPSALEYLAAGEKNPINPVNPVCPMESFHLIPSGVQKKIKNRIHSTLSAFEGKNITDDENLKIGGDSALSRKEVASGLTPLNRKLVKEIFSKSFN